MHASPAGVFFGAPRGSLPDLDLQGDVWCHVGGEGIEVGGFFATDLDPVDVLKNWSAFAGDFEDLGSETIAGTNMRHYHVAENEDLPIPTPMDLWVDDDGRLRRLEATGVGESMTMDFSDFGADVAIPEMPAATPPATVLGAGWFTDYCFLVGANASASAP
jgi:hypothetical protein